MIATRDNWTIDSSEVEVVIPGNGHDLGLTVKRNATGFVAVELGMGASPEVFTPDLIRSEQMRLGGKILPDGTIRNGWRFRKEYLRDATAASGQLVFEPEWLDWQRQHLCEPAHRMDLDLTPADMTLAEARTGLPEGFRLPTSNEPCPVALHRDATTDMIVLGPAFWAMAVDARRRELGNWLVPKAKGRIACWVRPDSPPAELPAGMGSAERTFAAGADVGEGVQASETTAVVLTGDTYEQAAEFGSAQISPGRFGILLAALCKYYNRALALPVRKMHGLTVIRAMVEECRYGNIWHHRIADRIAETRVAALGWAKGEMDELMFGRLVTAVQDRRIVIHSATLFEQFGQYIYDDAGRICHQVLASIAVEERKRHGDRAVGTALAWRAAMDLPLVQRAAPPAPAPPGSYAWLVEEEAAAKRQKDSEW